MDATINLDPFDGPIDYERIKALASRRRPAYTLIAMAAKNDPFYITPGRRRKAEWFAALWREYCEGRLDAAGRPSRMHIRGIHYVLISVAERPRMEGDGKPYENTDRCFTEMDEASRDARLLGLVPIGRIIDQRNDAPVEFLPNWSDSDGRNASMSIMEARSPEIDAAPLETIDGPAPALIIGEVPLRPLMVLGLSNAPDLIGMPEAIEVPDLPEIEMETCEGNDLAPQITIRPPQVTPPWFHIELWCEKTTMNDILLTIARERRLNVITGPGFQSLTGSWRLIERAKRSRRPVRIFYISDFDWSGQNMPVAVARVIEFLLRREGLDLDVKLLPIALTYEQCLRYQLPRTPIKETVAGKRTFEERYGEGATELDALEALHPGVLRQIILQEIDRYRDPTFRDRMQEEEQRLQDEVDRVRAEIVAPHQEDLDGLAASPQEIVERRDAEVTAFVTERLDALNTQIAEICAGPVESINERIAAVRQAVRAIDEEIYRLFAPRLAPLNAVIEEVRGEAEALDAQVRRIRESGIEDINRGIRGIDERCQAEISEVTERLGQIQEAIRGELESAVRPVLEAAEWPEPAEAAGIAPLFDSGRSYLDQIDVYKTHQGKATAGADRNHRNSSAVEPAPEVPAP